MLTTIALILAASVLRIGAQTPPPTNDLPTQAQTLPMLLPTVPPDQLFAIVQPQSAPPVMNLPPSPGRGIQYEHSISLGPNSNYYVYYSDHVQNSQQQQQQHQEQHQQQLSQSPLVYQPLVGYSNDQSSQILFNPNTVPVQLVTLLQPTLDAAVAQENAAATTPATTTEKQSGVDLNEEGIQKLVSSTQNLVSNEDVVSINNAEEEPTEAVAKESKSSIDNGVVDAPVDNEPSESRKNEQKLADNLAVASFAKPIIVGEMPEGTARNHRSGDRSENYLKQINVEIIGESDDHNKGQYLKETIFPANELTSEPCDDDQKSTPVLIKHEVTTIRPISLSTKGRGTTASRLSTRFRTTTAQQPSSTARYTAKETTAVTPKPVSNKYLAPIQAGLRLSNSEPNIDDCLDAILQPPKQDLNVEKKTLVEIQKSVNIKNILVDQEKPQPAKQQEFGSRTKIIQQPIFIEKPVEKIVKQNVYIEKPVDRIIQQPVYIEKPVPHPVDRIVEKKVPVPYPVEKIVEKPVQTVVQVPYAVEKQVPVHHYIDRPVTQHVAVPVPVERIVEKPYPVDRVVTKEVQVPYPVTQFVEKIVDRPVPVEKIITKEVQVPYPVTHVVDRPYPVEVPVEKIVEKIVDRPVETVVEKHVEVPVPVTVEKVVEKFIDRPVPYPVQVPVEIPVQVPVHYPVEIPVGVPIPYPVEKLVPVPIHEPKPTHAIIKTTTHEKLFDFHKFFGGKKKHFTEHIFIKAPSHPKPQHLEAKNFYFHSQYPKNDLHFGASIQTPTYVDVAQFNVLPHHYPEKQKFFYGAQYSGDAFNGNPYQYHYNSYQPLNDHSHQFVGKLTYQGPSYQQQQPQSVAQQIYRDDYVGPTPLLEDHWAVKSDVKFRRSPSYGKSLRIEYGGFKPPLVPSVEIDENGNPLKKEQNGN
ncbi:titin-like [Topomyia yanbarensis]|uniref:titin-like n=1 Tax=Topomyia yanbarensis TaxID=2498891 RepID=UPI00273C6EE7|nr:titin-like [Topomyia yanbarensis]